jgi:hydrogenase 3 maturation protease
MSSRKHSLKRDLNRWFSGAERVVVAGVGNPIRMDDYVGVKIVQDLQGKVSNRVMLIECETVPESYIQQIIDFKPTHVLLIDAAMLELKSGETKLVSPNELAASSAFSTHMLPLRLFCGYVAKEVNAKIGLLLLQPARVNFGEGLSPEVEKAGCDVVALLYEILLNIRPMGRN